MSEHGKLLAPKIDVRRVNRIYSNRTGGEVSTKRVWQNSAQRNAAQLFRIVENDSQRVALARMDGADAVTQIRSIITPRPANRPIVNGENHCIALIRRKHFNPRLATWVLFGKDELAAGEVSTPLAQKNRQLKWKMDFAVKISM
jgi:hypothetical protein